MSTTSSSSSTSIPPLFNPAEFRFTVVDRDEYAEPSSISIEPIVQNPDFEADTHKRFNKKERKQRVEILQKIQQELMTIYMTPIWKERSRAAREECEKGVQDEMKRLRGMDKEMERMKKQHEKRKREIERLEKELEEEAKPKKGLKGEDKKVSSIKESGGPVRVGEGRREKEVYMALSATFFILALFPDLRTLLLQILFQH